ncbi:MAG: potassium channel family protein [Amphritea sp.]
MKLVIERLSSLRFFLLFCAIIMLLILSALFEVMGLHEFYIDILFTLLILAVLHITNHNRSHLIIALCLTVPWVVVVFSPLIWSGSNLKVFGDLLFILLNSFIICIVLQQVLTAPKIDFNMLCGAVSVYLGLGLTWAVSYRAIEAITPGAFNLISVSIYNEWNQFLYFSFVTITTLGYGDVTPVSAIARIWSVLEVITGTLYITILIARLISLYQQR